LPGKKFGRSPFYKKPPNPKKGGKVYKYILNVVNYAAATAALANAVITHHVPLE
jgi:hypothetical protein